MSDIPKMDGFEEEEPLTTEIITLKPGEAPPTEDDEGDDDKVVLSKEEFEQLKGGQSSTDLLANGLRELKETLSQPQQPANVQQQPGESDEEFESRLERELFAEGKSGKAIKEAVARYTGAQTGQLMGMLSAQNKKLLALDGETGPIFNRYRSEIEKVVSELPEQQQNHPQVWEYAYNQVKDKHKGELQSEEVSSLVEKEVQRRLAELGIEPSGGANGKEKKKSAPFMESGRGSANVNTGGAKPKRVYATAEDKRIADIKGVPIEQYLKNKGRL